MRHEFVPLPRPRHVFHPIIFIKGTINSGHCPPNTICIPNVGSKAGQGSRRWPSLDPALGGCLVFGGLQSYAYILRENNVCVLPLICLCGHLPSYAVNCPTTASAGKDNTSNQCWSYYVNIKIILSRSRLWHYSLDVCVSPTSCVSFYCRPWWLCFNHYNAEMCLNKPWRPKGLFWFQMVIEILVSSFFFIWIPLL